MRSGGAHIEVCSYLILGGEKCFILATAMIK